MGKLTTLLHKASSPRRVLRLLMRKTTRLWSDEAYIRSYYYLSIGKKLNLNNPKTFNEKMQWLKLYDRREEYTQTADKYEVKKYVAGIIGEEYIIPTLGVWDKFDDIDFAQLPRQFVLKCTHDSGSVVICKDKATLDIKKARKKLTKALNTPYYYSYREYPYKNIKPRIIAEKYMESEMGELRDYKLMCFGGKMRCLFVCTDRDSKIGLHLTFFDREWNKLPFERYYPSSNKPIEKPKQYDKMIELAEILSKDLPFMRVDFYEIDGHIYFGELTLYPGSGMKAFKPEEWDYTLGEWIELPKK